MYSATGKAWLGSLCSVGRARPDRQGSHGDACCVAAGRVITGRTRHGTLPPTKSCVTGHIYDTAGGVPQRNWVLQLEGPDGTIRTTHSNSNGRYEFSGLVPGVYTVSERVEPGWHVVSPQASVITVAPARACVDVDFWNERNQEAPPIPER